MDKKAELEALGWYVTLAQNWPDLDTDDKRKEFQFELRRFLLKYTGGVQTQWLIHADPVTPQESGNTPVESRRDWTESLESWITRIVEAAAHRHSVSMPWPVWRSLQWQSGPQKYVNVPDRARETIHDTMLGLLLDLLQRHGHLVKTCKAFKAGSYAIRCEKVFVGERKTALYCSDACKFRTFKRNARRNPKNKTKVKAK